MTGVQTCALPIRSEEHTSELQSHDNLVCRLLIENTSPPFLRCRAGRVSGPWHWSRTPIAVRASTAAVCCFFNDTATTEIYTLSLHDALPINDTATTEIYTLSLHDVPISVVAVSLKKKKNTWGKKISNRGTPITKKKNDK